MCIIAKLLRSPESVSGEPSTVGYLSSLGVSSHAFPNKYLSDFIIEEHNSEVYHAWDGEVRTSHRSSVQGFAYGNWIAQ